MGTIKGYSEAKLVIREAKREAEAKARQDRAARRSRMSASQAKREAARQAALLITKSIYKDGE